MQISDLDPENTFAIEQVAKLLVEGFAHMSDAWADPVSALEEVQESFGADRISRIAHTEHGEIVGWIAGHIMYESAVWELHPLVVSIQHQGHGVGRALVRDFEECVKERGGLTIMLGTDDESNSTTLGGINLFPNVWEHIAHIKNLKHHPYEFYQKLGYAIVGVVPDANGPGKPDILMAKSLMREVIQS